MTLWYQFKLFIEHATGVSMDALHVIVGVALQLVIARVIKAPLNDLRPWLCVFILLLVNEASDLWAEQWPEPAMQFGEGFKDIILTMLLPTLLLVFARLRPEDVVTLGGKATNGEPDDLLRE